jgi:hypothetical protein
MGIKFPLGDGDGEETRLTGVNGDGDGGISPLRGQGWEANPQREISRCHLYSSM